MWAAGWEVEAAGSAAGWEVGAAGSAAGWEAGAAGSAAVVSSPDPTLSRGETVW